MTTIPTSITDKNGKNTTVHKKTIEPAVASKRSRVAPVLASGETDYDLADGGSVTVPNSVADFRGTTTNEFGDTCLVVVGFTNRDGSEHLVALTPCCNAHASADYDEDMEMAITFCKKCFNEVDDMHGGEITAGQYVPLAAA